MSSDVIRTVLLEVRHGSCKVLRADERPVNTQQAGSFDDPGGILRSLAEILPEKRGLVPASLVIPSERVIEFTIQVPKDLSQLRDEWEHWEISAHLIGDEDQYLYETSYLKDSICGKYQIRNVRATRRRYLDRLTDQARSIGILIDQVFFPQSVWGRIVSSFCTGNKSETSDWVFIGRGSAFLVRTSGSRVTDLLPAQLPADGSTNRFAETIETLLSWHISAAGGGGDRVVVDGGNHTALAAELVGKLRFKEFESDRVARILHGTIESPERFLLPLSALGVI